MSNKYAEKKRMVIIGAIAIVLGMAALTICANATGILWLYLTVDRSTSLVCIVAGALLYRQWRLIDRAEKINKYRQFERQSNDKT